MQTSTLITRIIKYDYLIVICTVYTLQNLTNKVRYAFPLMAINRWQMRSHCQWLYDSDDDYGKWQVDYDFLFALNSNHSYICLRFRDTDDVNFFNVKVVSATSGGRIAMLTNGVSY